MSSDINKVNHSRLLRLVKLETAAAPLMLLFGVISRKAHDSGARASSPCSRHARSRPAPRTLQARARSRGTSVAGRTPAKGRGGGVGRRPAAAALGRPPITPLTQVAPRVGAGGGGIDRRGVTSRASEPEADGVFLASQAST